MQSKHHWYYAGVTKILMLTDSIKLFELTPENGMAINYGAGSHINVEVLVDGKIQNRSYSLVGLPNGRTCKIAVKRLQPGRGGSIYMFGLMKNSRLKISQPLNDFEIYRHRANQPADQVVLIAGGIGITPLYTISHALKRHGVNCQLHYTVKTEKEICFRAELSELLGSDLFLYASKQQRRLNLDRLLSGLPESSVVYFCGPIPMLEQARKIWQQQQRPEANFRFETFGSSGRFAAEPFEVKIPRLNKSVLVPENRSMLDMLTDAGIEIIYDCKNGECGLCALDIIGLNGTVDHRDVFFSEQEKAENSQMCSCVSRIVGGSVTVDTADRPDDLSFKPSPPFSHI